MYFWQLLQRRYYVSHRKRSRRTKLSVRCRNRMSDCCWTKQLLQRLETTSVTSALQLASEHWRQTLPDEVLKWLRVFFFLSSVIPCETMRLIRDVFRLFCLSMLVRLPRYPAVFVWYPLYVVRPFLWLATLASNHIYMPVECTCSMCLFLTQCPNDWILWFRIVPTTASSNFHSVGCVSISSSVPSCRAYYSPKPVSVAVFLQCSVLCTIYSTTVAVNWQGWYTPQPCAWEYISGAWCGVRRQSFVW